MRSSNGNGALAIWDSQARVSIDNSQLTLLSQGIAPVHALEATSSDLLYLSHHQSGEERQSSARAESSNLDAGRHFADQKESTLPQYRNPGEVADHLHLPPAFRRRRFNYIGRLPIETTFYRDMDDDSTQPSTYPVDQADHNRSSNNLSGEDELDIICLLRPCSRAAFDIAEKVARRSPQHVLHSGEIPQRYRKVVEMADEVDLRSRTSPEAHGPEVTPDMNEVDMTDYPDNGNADIALRLSSRVIDMDMGFVFGRDPRKCDIVLPVEDKTAVRISGMHFRIFLNDNGMIMLEDTSTNGTLVDNFLLKHKHPVPGNSVRRILQKGSVVAVFVKPDKTTARFIVDIPQRRDESAWRQRLEQYVTAVKRARHQKMILLRNLGTDKGGLPATLQKGQPIEDTIPGENMFITAGTTPWNHGMRWNGEGRYKVVAKLGSGAFATVYKLVNASSGNELAAKEIEKRRFMKNGVLDMKITTELNILKRLKHPHVIESFDHVDTPRDLYILMELVPYGDLSIHVGGSDKLSDHDMRLIAKQMCQALAYLHDNGIAHRDIKPENIIKKTVKPLWIKLADFGLSKIITQDDHHTAYQTFCGTLLYCAPEVYPGFAHKRAGLPPDPRTTKPSPYSTAVDIWSLAAVLFHLLCSKPPYEASAANHGVHMLDTIFEERFPRRKFDDAEVHPDWELFFENTLQLTAQQRWSARRLLKLPWMRKMEDVKEVTYEFQNPDKDFALEDESSDEDMDGFDDDENFGRNAYAMPDATQLSLNNDPHSDEEDFLEQIGASTTTILRATGMTNEGLGIEIGSQQRSAFGEQSSVSSRYNLRSQRHTEPSERVHQPLSTSRTDNTLNMVPPQQTGRLFGEIASSGVLGSVLPAPQISSTENWQSSPTGGLPSYQPSAFAVPGAKHRLSDRDSDISTLSSPKRSRVFGEQQLEMEPRISSAASGSSQLFGGSEPDTHVDDPTHIHETSHRRDHNVHGLSLSLDPYANNTNNPSMPDTAVARDFLRDPRLLSPSNQTSRIARSIEHGGPPPMSQGFFGPSMVSSSRPPTPQHLARSEVKALGVLTPSRKSLRVDQIFVTGHQTQYGRAMECTYRFPDRMDTRVPKSAFTIVLYDPNGDDAESDKDWIKTNFYAVIATRCSGYILINDIAMTRNKTADGEKFQFGILQTGDVIEVFDKSGEHLRFHVHFWFGASKARRDKNDPFKVILGRKALSRTIANKEAALSGGSFTD